MAETLSLRIVTPERLLLEEEVDEVTAPGAIGEFGVLPNHITFLSALQPGRLTYKQGVQTRTLVVSGGFAEVIDNVMTVLADSAEFANEIDLERARVALRTAEEQLKMVTAGDQALAEAEAARRRAQARIEATSGGSTRPA